MSENIIQIERWDDPRVAPYRDIRERDLVKNQSSFIAEGKTVLAVLASQKRFAVQSVLILENRLAGLTAILKKLDENVPIYVISRQVIDQLAGFAMHRGVLALAGRATDCDAPPSTQTARNWKRVVALSQLSNHDNMGSVFRNAAAFGIDAVLMDKTSCDPLYRKSVRVSVGGVLKVPFFRFPTTEEMLGWLESGKFETVAFSPGGTGALHQWRPAERTALVFGTEGEGLPPTILKRLKTLRIAMSRDFDSLNVATSCGIALHHLYTDTTGGMRSA